jgi:hypothetical protein
MEGNGGQRNLQRAMAALERAGARLECPSCGHTYWSREPDPVVLAISPAEGELSHRLGIPTYALICNGCGFVRLHAVKVLFGDGG